MSLSEEIKNIRMKLFLSQVSFAEALNISFSTVNRWENGKGKPNLTAMKSILKYCEENQIPFENLEYEWRNARKNA